MCCCGCTGNANSPELFFSQVDKKSIDQLGKAAANISGGTHDAGKDAASQHRAIEENLKIASRGEFLNQFGYAYNGDASEPPAAASGSFVRGFEDLIVSDNNEDDHIAKYVNRSIFNNLPIEVGVKEAAVTNLTGFISRLLASGQGAFSSEKYAQSFTYPSKDSPSQAVRVEAAIHYCNLDIPNHSGGDGSVVHHFVHYSGVVYVIQDS